MKNQLKRFLIVGSFALVSVGMFAQSNDHNPIVTAMPSLTIAPDARGGGMGDAGVATAPDIFSQHWNPAKYAFAPSKAGFGISYTPWLRKIVNDIDLVYAAGYYKLGNSDNQALSSSIRYFSVGDVDMHDQYGKFFNSVSPYELAFDLTYSRKLSSTFSGAVTFRFIRSDYSTPSEGGDVVSAGNTFAADIAGYNESYINIGRSESLLSFGFNISNLGGKISSNTGLQSRFIPANLKLGGSLMYPVSEMSTLSLSLDLNKLLVPTPPKMDDEDYQQKLDEYYAMGSIKGVFKSFGDASFSEELKEITTSIGMEYDYDKKFKLRTGYFNESKMKGNRQYMTFGAGFHFKAFQLDAAYLLSTSGNNNPLDQTLRFSLGFDIEGIQNLFK